MADCACGCGIQVQRRFAQGHNMRGQPRRTKAEIQRRYQAKIRDEAFEAYGGPRCVCCGETEKAFLVFDHIDDDGAEHRRQGLASKGWKQKRDGFGGHTFLRWLRDQGWPPVMQVLCANCNMAKMRVEGCPHQREDVGLWHKD